MNKLTTALGIALLSTTTQAVKLDLTDEAANDPCADCDCEADDQDPCCNSGYNNVTISIDFSVEVQDPPAVEVAAAAEADPNAAPVTPPAAPEPVIATGPIALNDMTDIGNAETWSDIKTAALADADAFKASTAYTDRTARERAIIDALIAAAGQTNVIPAGTTINIMYTSQGITEASASASAAAATQVDPSLTRFLVKLGSDSTLPLGDLVDGEYQDVAWEDLDGAQFNSNEAGQVDAFKTSDKYKALSNYEKAEFDALVALTNQNGSALEASSNYDATPLFFVA